MSRCKALRSAGFIVGLAGAAVLMACTAKPVSFETDIKPILEAKCVECHRAGAQGTEASGLRLDSYEGVMAGTRFGNVVIPGDSLTSVLVMLIEGRADPSIAMPHNEDELDPMQIGLIRDWVEQGARDN